MEIDFTGLNVQKRTLLISTASLAMLLILGLVGWILLPDRVLTWTEWQVIQQSLAYNQEIRLLTRNADRLADLLQGSPDPVRAQLVTEKVRRHLHQMEIASLEIPRDTLSTAADATYSWSLGTVEKETAIASLQTANQSIQKAIEVTVYE
ncbi:MAG: hypothetical protein ISR58_12345 [Anaerolineales bacterium]|nr:hypothetical protein [Chloroflexota bacterium]MBL6981968.1 hypothetical protein [Anaerolineales bacterium]